MPVVGTARPGGRATGTAAPISGAGGPVSSTGQIRAQADGTAIVRGLAPEPVSPVPHRVTASMAPPIPMGATAGHTPPPGVYGHPPVGAPPAGSAPVGPPPIGRVRLPEADADGSGPSGRQVRYANQVHNPASRGLIGAVLAIVLTLLGIIPTYLMLSAGTGSDLAAIKALDLPSWATGSAIDHTSGNRWCISSCLKSERTMTSTQSVTATAAAYDTALRKAGWQPAPRKACPPAAKGTAQSCWVLDRDQLNVLVTTSICMQPPPAPTEPSFSDPAGSTQAASPPKGCVPTTVDVSVFDRIDLKPAKS